MKKGDKVTLKKGIYGDAPYNPAWGGKYGKQVGIITNAKSQYTNDDMHIDVKWRGYTNTYKKSDLNLYKEEPKITNQGREFNFKQ